MVFGTIGGLIAGAIGLAGTAATVVGSFIGGALAFGAQSLLKGYLGRKKARDYSAAQGEIQIGGNIPAQAIFGKAKTKGHRLYYAKYEPGDAVNSEVLVLSNGWCDGLEPYVYFYGKKHNLVELPKIGNEVAHYGVEGYWYDNDPNGENCFSIRFYDGRPGQQVDQRLVDETAGLETTWKATSRVSGHAYVVLRMLFDGDLDFAENPRPDLEFVLRGLREYDPRKDSTVAGGSGTHRIDDASTWEWTENPAVHRLNYQLGIRGLISGRTIIGEGKTLGQIDLGTYFASMNVCDTLKNGKPTYACSLIVNADDDHTEILKEFDDAMAGYGLNRRGLSGVIAGAPQLPVLEIIKDDIPADRAKDIRYRKSAFDLFNHMSGQFTSIEDSWNPASLKPIHVNADVAADGRVRQTSNDFLQVTDPDIAQYLLTIRYRQQRRGGAVTLPVSRRVGLRVSEGQWVEFEGREWLIRRWNVDESFRFTLTLAETGADIYSDEAIEPGPIVVPSSPPINPSNLPNVQNFAVAVASIEGSDGQEVPALAFTWTPPSDPQITEVRFEYVVGTDPTGATVYRDVTAGVEDGEYVTSKDVQPGVFYTARCTIRTVPDRIKVWSAWITTAGTTGPVTVYPEGIVEGLNELVGEATEWIGSGVRELIDEVQRSALLTIEQDTANYRDKQTLRRELTSGLGAERAAWSEAITVATGPGSALAQSIETLEVEVNETIATGLSALTLRVEDTEDGLTVQGQAIDVIEAALPGKASVSALNALTLRVEDTEDGLLAQADAITAVEAEVGDVSAGGVFRVQAQATPGDGWARIGLQASANDGATFESAALFLDARTTGTIRSRAGFVAEQFFITDGATDTQPFIYQDGVAYLSSIRVDAALIDNLTVEWAEIENAVVNNLVANTSNLNFGAVTGSGQDIDTGSVSQNRPFTTVAEVSVPRIYGGLLQLTGNIAANASVGSVTCRLRLVREDNLAVFYQTDFLSTTGSGNLDFDVFRLDPYPSANPTRYLVQVESDNINTTSESVSWNVALVSLHWKV